jgi:hypothetical protein
LPIKEDRGDLVVVSPRFERRDELGVQFPAEGVALVRVVELRQMVSVMMSA